MDARQHRAHPAAVIRLARRERQGSVRPPVERAEERDDLGATGRLPSQLDRPLNRLGAGVVEEHLVEPGRRDRHDRSRRLDHLRVVRGHRGVPETVDLLVDRGHDRGMAVAEVGDGDTAAEVEHVAAVDGVEVGSLGRTRRRDPSSGDTRTRSARRRARARSPRRRRQGGRSRSGRGGRPSRRRRLPDADPSEREEADEHHGDPRRLVDAEHVEVVDAHRLGGREATAMASAPAVRSTLQITRSIPARSRTKR